jgi:hypothetical protein
MLDEIPTGRQVAEKYRRGPHLQEIRENTGELVSVHSV